jgi:hypothetical protein
MKGMVWCKMDKKSNNKLFLGTTGLNIVNEYFVHICRSA